MQPEVIQAIRCKHPLLKRAEHLTASAVVADGPRRKIVYLPEGTHEIQASVNGQPGTRTVRVGADSLEPLSTALKARQAGNVRPYAGFDHKDGPASFLPVGFSYEFGRGVMLEIELTSAGQKAIDGKDYSYFSPTFHLDRLTGKPMGLLPHGEIGSLVNNPAFEGIERIAASRTDGKPGLSDLDRVTAEFKRQIEGKETVTAASSFMPWPNDHIKPDGEDEKPRQDPLDKIQGTVGLYAQTVSNMASKIAGIEREAERTQRGGKPILRDRGQHEAAKEVMGALEALAAGDLSGESNALGHLKSRAVSEKKNALAAGPGSAVALGRWEVFNEVLKFIEMRKELQKTTK